ncbi:MAG: response regulator [Spirochaetales bacterium]|nr:response regulator [Spirochaetales bacterium]
MYTLLLVDDEYPELEGLQYTVDWKGLGFDLQMATTSATEAMDFLTRQKVAVMVSDISMPVMSGLELFSRAKEFNPSIKALFISGHAEFSYAKRALEENAYGYILKPVDDDELIQKLKQLKRELDENLGDLASIPSEDKKHDESLLIRDIKRIVEEEIEQGVYLKELAVRLGFTANHIGHVFFQETGEHFSTYLTRKRLDKSKILLKNPSLKIYEVADRLGYKTISHFNRVFKRKFGITPGEYRDSFLKKNN